MHFIQTGRSNTKPWAKAQGIANRNLYFEFTVGRAVKAYAPALILWFGPPQRFGASLLKTGLPAPLVVFMGQTEECRLLIGAVMVCLGRKERRRPMLSLGAR